MSDKKDLWSSLFFLVFSLLLFFGVTPNHVDSPKFGVMSARFFPNLGTIILFVFSSALFISALLKIRKNKAPSDGAPQKETFRGKLLDPRSLRPYIVILIIFVQTYCFESFGYLVSTPLTLVAVMLAMGQYNYKVIVLNTIGVTGVLFVLFDQILGLALI